MYKETKRLIQKAIDENKLIVFVGAGASINSEIPSWNVAISKIKNKLNDTIGEDASNLQIPQIYFNDRGYKEYNQLMKEIFFYADKHPNELHRKIFELKPVHIITTNYDDFLERVSDERGEFLELIERDRDIPYIKNERMLVKMHGGFKYDNYVLKEDDYLNFSDNFKLIETFVKSLIAQYTVLFVGYSYSDPDTKQIFNWVKNILGNDLQRAYMIDAKDSYNQSLVDYYKNLGINLIYSKNCLCEDFKGNDIYNNTIKTLDWLINRDKINDRIVMLYNELKQYEPLNYIPSSFIQRALNNLNCGSSYEVVNLTSIEVTESSKFDFWCELRKVDTEESIKIIEILKKTYINTIRLLPWDSAKSEEISIFEHSNIIQDDFLKYIFDNDYVELKNWIEQINIYDKNINSNEKMQVAYYYYLIGDVSRAKSILKEISKEFKLSKNFCWHFIAEYNIKHISSQNIVNQKTENVSLQEIIYKYNLYNDEGSYLLEISNFSYFYYAYYQTSEMLKRVQSEILGADRSELDKMGLYVLDIYNFMMDNFLFIGKYKDIKAIFKNYFIACISSHFADKVARFNHFLDKEVNNYILPEISGFSVVCALDYCELKELYSIFELSDKKQMILSDDATQIIKNRAINYLISQNQGFLNFRDYDKISRIVFVASKVKFKEDDFWEMIELFFKILQSEKFNMEYINLFNNFIVNYANANNNQVPVEKLKSLILYIIEIHREKCPNVTYNYRYISSLFGNIVVLFTKNILENNNSIVDVKLVNDLITGKGKLQFLCVYKICDNEAQNNLKAYVETNVFNKIGEEGSFYYDALVNNVILPIESAEVALLEKLIILKKDKIKGVKLVPDPYDVCRNEVVNLYLNNHLIDIARFKQFFEEEDIYSFLFNMSNYDYQKFDLSWLQQISATLLENISQNEAINQKISRKFKNKFNDNNLSRKELDIYFKYFSN